MQDLAEYDAVVNCMGLRGASLFGDDSCYPIRGQVLRARAPWIKHHYVVDERFYVIPNNDLGGSPGSALTIDYDYCSSIHKDLKCLTTQPFGPHNCGSQSAASDSSCNNLQRNQLMPLQGMWMILRPCLHHKPCNPKEISFLLW